MEIVNAPQIFDLLEKEKSTGNLLPLDQNFYENVNNYIMSLKNSGNEQEVNNVEKILRQLKQKRQQKLLIYLAYNKPLPKPMPIEEENLYNEILKILSKSDEQVKSIKIKITADLPEVLTPEGKKIGPFKSGDIIETTDVKEANFIIVNKIGEEVK